MFEEQDSKINKKEKENEGSIGKVISGADNLKLHSKKVVIDKINKAEKTANNKEKKPSDNHQASKEFDQRMKDLHKKGRRRGKRYSFIGISVSVVILVAVFAAGYYFLTEVNTISSELEGKELIPLETSIDPDNICQMDFCCLASLKRIIKNEYQGYIEEEGCASGYEMKSLDCENSLQWCEPVQVEEKCINEGEYVDHVDLNSFICCAGLNKISAIPLDQNCQAITPENSPGIEPGWTCVNCGDGNCNKQANESICNCPADCTVSTSTDEKLEIDTDDDLLSNEEEVLYGTDPNNPDTDGDGYLDGEEVNAGFNPLGEGMLDNTNNNSNTVEENNNNASDITINEDEI